MKCKFIGTTSMGFESGKMYDISTRTEVVKRLGFKDCAWLVAYDDKNGVACPYDSLENFLENWEIV